MKIEILGTGCAGCRALYETVKEAVAELNLDAEVVKEENIEKILSYKVMALPALVIDGEVVSKGRRLTLDEVKQFLQK